MLLGDMVGAFKIIKYRVLGSPTNWVVFMFDGDGKDLFYLR